MGKKFLLFAMLWFIAMILLELYLESKPKNPVIDIKTVYTENISDPYYMTTINGTSMEQYGIKDKSTVKVYTKRECKEGDFCAFKCNAEKCVTKSHVYYLKKLITRNNDCYWFEGNPSPREEITTKINDNGSISKSIVKMISFDSRSYGFLCGNEVIINGKAEKEPIIYAEQN